MNNQQTLRLGMIGIGNIGSAHASAVSGGLIPHLELTALCDSDPSRAEALRLQYPTVPVFLSSDELIASGLCDAVVVSTPHYDHPPIATAALRAGLHVLSEKPLGVYCSAARETCRVAKESGKVYAVMFNQRASNLYREARRIVRSGELGELKRSIWIVTNWYRKQCYYDSGDWRATWSGEGGGVLMNQAPHNLDLFQWICGMPVSVRAECHEAHFHSIEVEDDATLFFRYANGATGLFVTSTGDFPGTNRLEITGTLGKLVIENKTLTLTRLSMDEREYRMTADGVKNPLSVTTLEHEPYQGHHRVLEQFARHVLFGDDLIAHGEEGLCELTLSNAAYLSAWQGGSWIDLPMDDAAYLQALEERISHSSSEKHTHSTLSSHEGYSDRWNTNW